MFKWFTSLFKRPQWVCTHCEARCISVHDLVCGDPDATYEIPTMNEYGNKYIKVVPRSACPLDRI